MQKLMLLHAKAGTITAAPLALLDVESRSFCSNLLVFAATICASFAFVS